ncbi:hypothetical protein [Nocardiopsis sp. CC223A]|uniref:hypothetical protein n=1 Tax=Nocardiopsis sp. CC223A TaxID=3044051 RepID=UPI00278BF57B|nr:hypothetical protein [Nocardiopsis sp. CC223A]
MAETAPRHLRRAVEPAGRAPEAVDGVAPGVPVAGPVPEPAGAVRTLRARTHGRP